MLLILASLAAPVAAQQRPSGEQLALDLRRNVVAIEAVWADGTVRDGFGIIAGERGGETYVVTADHVVRGPNPEEVAERITLQLFERQGRPIEGTLLGTRDVDLDLAVITARLPADVGWRADVLAPDPGSLQRGTEVWFVGRGGEWYVPTRPGLVNAVRRRRHEIVVDDLPVAVGTSGAPLVSAGGIVGIVVSDESVSTAHATLIDVVASTFREWGHPWALTPVGSPPERTPTVVNPAAIEAALRLTSAQWREVQRALAALGHRPGPADGVPGLATRAALGAWQRARGAEATGYLTPEEHTALLAAADAEAPPAGAEVAPESEAEAIPEEAWRERDVGFLEGCWQLGTDYAVRNIDTGVVHRVVAWEVCFEGGVGRQELTFDNGNRCRGPMSGAFAPDGRLLLRDQGDVPCDGGERIFEREVACERVDSEYARCEAVGLSDGSRAPVTFRREAAGGSRD